MYRFYASAYQVDVWRLLASELNGLPVMPDKCDESSVDSVYSQSHDQFLTQSLQLDYSWSPNIASAGLRLMDFE